MKEKSNNSFLSTLAERKVYINLGAYDFRCGIDTLVATSTATCQKDFDEGALFSYCGKAKDQVRIVFWEGCGAWMISRKISIGRIQWPSKNSDEEQVLSCYKDLMALLQDPISENELTRREVVKKLSK